MSPLRHHFAIAAAVVRNGVAAAWQEPATLLLDLLNDLVWIVGLILPLFLILDGRDTRSYSFAELELLLAVFVLVQAIVCALVIPSLQSLVAAVDGQNLDYLLLRPAGTFWSLVWLRVDPVRCVRFVAAAALVLDARSRDGALLAAFAPALLGVLAGAAMLFAVWCACVAGVLSRARLYSTMHMVTAWLEFARWPASFFGRLGGWILTWVVPIGIITNTPVDAAVGRLSALELCTALGVGLAAACASWILMRRAARREA